MFSHLTVDVACTFISDSPAPITGRAEPRSSWRFYYLNDPSVLGMERLVQPGCRKIAQMRCAPACLLLENKAISSLINDLWDGWHREKRSGTLAKSAVSAPAGAKKDLDVA